jgi:hypothetical protein
MKEAMLAVFFGLVTEVLSGVAPPPTFFFARAR